MQNDDSRWCIVPPTGINVISKFQHTFDPQNLVLISYTRFSFCRSPISVYLYNVFACENNDVLSFLRWGECKSAYKARCGGSNGGKKGNGDTIIDRSFFTTVFQLSRKLDLLTALLLWPFFMKMILFSFNKHQITTIKVLGLFKGHPKGLPQHMVKIYESGQNLLKGRRI